MKTIKILLEPVFRGDRIASVRGKTILTEISPLSAGTSIVGLFTKHGNLPTQAYENLKAEDEKGELILTWEDTGARKNIRQWKADRDTDGAITFHWEAFPRQVTSKTMAAPRSDTRLDRGGIEFGALSTIAMPWDNTTPSREIYRKIIEWDLRNAIPGTRAVSSYGEGPQALERTSDLQNLMRLFFMAGPIKSFPPVNARSKHPHFGYYWFGDDTPERITSLGEFVADCFDKMSDFFQDPSSDTNGYRVFVRCASPAQAHGGAGGERSFLLEYNDSLPTMSPDSILYLLSHEMVHNWPLLDGTPFSTAPDDLVSWFNEGVADYYGSVLPYRFGLASKASYLTQMNSILTAYYTNSLRHISDKDSYEKKWDISDAFDIPYKRGFAYFCLLDAEIRRKSPGKSLGDLVIEIYRRQRDKEPYGLPVFLTMIREVAPDMIPVFHDMQAGKTLIVPPNDALGSDFEIIEVAQEVFELGFSEDGLSRRQVTGLIDNSRAKESGLKEGDEIIKNTFLWQCRGELDQKMTMNIRRDGEEMEIVYWPRSFKKVSSWQFREKS